MTSIGRLVLRPLVLLGVLLVVSTASRAAWLGEPPTLVSDEIFYVNAARHIASFPPGPGDIYAPRALGRDPNFEHPPLAKVIIAGSMKVLGNKSLAWRIPSVAFGTLAVGLVYWLARSVGASGWTSLGAAALMATDNMTLAYGRFATLDIFVVAFMILGVGLYLRDRPWLAGVALGVGACTKLIGLSALAVVGVMEVLRRAQRHRELKPVGAESPVARPAAARTATSRLAACGLAALVTYLGLLGVLDRTVTDFGDPVTHTRQMLNYAERTTFQMEEQSRGTWTQGTLAPVVRPWEWFLNRGQIGMYHKEGAPPGQPGSERRLVLYEARMTPAILALALPALLLAAWRSWSRADDGSNLALAWCSAIFLLLVAVVLRGRISYLYYVVILLPGVYIAIARMFSEAVLPSFRGISPLRLSRALAVAYTVVMAASLVSLFPFRTWGGR
jgi:4-amino-4-deoxy-L-arabinose transferase-like glycosyltransferase